MDEVSAARALVEERFPEASMAFLAANEARTATSDLDVVVVLPGLGLPYRSSVRWRGWPVELFVHGETSLAAYLERDFARRQPSLPRMCGFGEVLADASGRAKGLQELLRRRVEAGPGPSDLDGRRYGLTDLLDDLTGGGDPAEQAMVRWRIVESSARLALAAAGRWEGTGKWLVRELRALDPSLADALLSAHDDPVRLAAVAGGVLEGAGGRLWEGYHADGDPFHQRLQHITPGDLSSETAQSSGMHRLAAVRGSNRLWMGQTRVAPSTASADHHHGDSETAIYVVSGTPRFVFLEAGEEVRLETEPGDYIFVPPYVPHREENPDPSQEAVVVIARSTREAIVVNLPDLRLP
ncbi:cupin domain-containing protein [Nonomuraea sp. NPDC050556]|uniref:cupin domain-containing protein n=1 Tax=Nonomuraea sp. NPDC050556 TaxID=3364369 RepID=UPI0037B4399F